MAPAANSMGRPGRSRSRRGVAAAAATAVEPIEWTNPSCHSSGDETPGDEALGSAAPSEEEDSEGAEGEHMREKRDNSGRGDTTTRVSRRPARSAKRKAKGGARASAVPAQTAAAFAVYQGEHACMHTLLAWRICEAPWTLAAPVCLLQPLIPIVPSGGAMRTYVTDCCLPLPVPPRSLARSLLWHRSGSIGIRIRANC